MRCDELQRIPGTLYLLVAPYQEEPCLDFVVHALGDVVVPERTRYMKMDCQLLEIGFQRTYDVQRFLVGEVKNLKRKHASVYGNPLGVFSYLGLAEDPRVKLIVDSLVDWQWPDGGWNCDSNPNAHHSSFYESLATLWG